jgi:hypothetical protein
MPAPAARRRIMAWALAGSRSVVLSCPVLRPMVRNRGPLESGGDPAAAEIGVQVGLKIVVAWPFMALAALLPQPHPEAILHLHVGYLHGE